MRFKALLGLAGATLMLLCLLDGLSAKGAPSTKSVNAEDLLAVARIKWMSLSPDGQQILLRADRPDIQSNRIRSEWWVVGIAQQQPPLRLPEDVAILLEGQLLSWRPHSNVIVFVRAEQGLQFLWQLDVRTSSVGRLSEGPLASQDSTIPYNSDRKSTETNIWSPDGMRLAYLVTRKENYGSGGDATVHGFVSGGEYPHQNAGVEADAKWTDGNDLPTTSRDSNSGSAPAAVLYVYDLRTGNSRQVSGKNQDVGRDYGSFSWSPDGRKIIYTAEELHIADLESGADEKLADTASSSWPSWSPDGDSIVFTSFRRQISGIVIRNLRQGSGEWEVKAATSFPAGAVLGRAIWSHDKTSLIVEVAGRMRKTIYEIHVAPLRVEDRFLDWNVYQWISYCAQADRLVFTSENVGRPARVFVTDTKSWKLQELFDPNSKLRTLAWPMVSAVKWRSQDRRFVVHGLLVAPSSRRMGTKLPLIVHNLGGPSAVVGTFNFGDMGQYPIVALASQGYLVLTPNSRGRSGYGDKFLGAIREEQSYVEHPAQDVLAGVEKMIREGDADATRLGIMGFSYGGGLTAWSICRTDRFRAASIGEAVYIDSVRFLANHMGNESLRAFFTEEYGLPNPYIPSQRRLLERENPIDHVDSVHTPSLSEYGVESQHAVGAGRPWFQAMQFFKIPSELVVYPRSGHGLREPVLQLDSYRRNLDWFNFWLKDESYPDKNRQEIYDAWKSRQIRRGDRRWVPKNP